MTEVRETRLPGVGVKHDFTTDDGRDVGVLVHRDGRRDIVVYDRDDPDTCSMQVMMNAADARTLAELLGTSQVNAAVQSVQQEIEGLAIEWLTIGAGSRAADRTIGDGEFRTKTGASVVAVIRSDTPFPAPGPEFGLLQGDVVVCVGTTDGLNLMRDLVAAD
ncbi:cation:proton antiporter regulatory subunit [Ilumatobacter sp.]|uniref:cation:proton antiporter regulatory subunit n=1 Tax=Ilumatobacter sp. TaxID=1967498 RepID=UPI003C4D3080